MPSTPADQVQQAFSLAHQHHQAGRLAEAESFYRQVLEREPAHAEALHRLGILALQVGRHDLALHYLGATLALTPHNPAAHAHLGEALQGKGQIDAAITSYQRAIQLRPDFPEAHNNLGNLFADQGRLEEALLEYQRALEILPSYAQGHNNLGTALTELHRLPEAVEAYRRALQLQPDFAEAHSNLGNGLKTLGHLDEALSAHRRAMQLRPDFAGARHNASHVLLVQGDFEQGWPLFESRWETAGLRRSKRDFLQPMWKGEALQGRRVLLHAEQGFGDTLQFIRYAPLVAARGGTVIVECQPGLRTLLAALDGVSHIIEPGDPLPAFDLHCPLMSLPLAFGTRLNTIPAPIPYLHADPRKAALWRQRLAQEIDAARTGPSSPRPLKVGLVWAGRERPQQPDLRPINQRRSLRLNQLAPLAGVPGVVFVSLQKDLLPPGSRTPPPGLKLLDWTDELEDFADTAALVDCLDLIITVDTAVAHLAGAMGKPVWMLNRFDTCWRWLLGREDSPWYPTMRLFRQPRFMDWDPVLAEVHQQLALLSSTAR